jgi:hypothetical protein
MFEVLRAEEIGMTLTENYAMTPASSRLGLLPGAPAGAVLQRRAHRRDQLASRPP